MNGLDSRTEFNENASVVRRNNMTLLSKKRPIRLKDNNKFEQVGSDAADPKDFPEEKQDACWKKLLRFLFSWLGLFILLAAYTLGGAYYFHVKESRLERLQEQKISNAAKDIQDAEKYIADMMEYITFDKRGKMNNCSQFVNEPHYVKSQTFYAQVCLDQSKVTNKFGSTRYCKLRISLS